MKTVKNLGDWATLGIAKHFEKIVKYEQEVLADREIEDLHQMRVGMRRLRSTMTSLGLALDLPKAAREQKVGKIARILGTLRDLDVLGQVLTTEYQPHLPKSEAQILAEVIEVLTTQRQEAFKKVKECLHDRLYLNFKQDLNTWLENPIYQPIGQILLSTVLPDLLLPQASRLLLHPGWLVGIDCQKTDIETLL